MPGTLYVVATPIGNLEDITYRAVRILREVTLIACEDTRQTRKLLNHFHISTTLVSFHDHNERARTQELIERLESGDSIALVSDAGTPLISDPGFRLVEAAASRAITVTPIPGASAAMAALSASGLSTDSFRFVGFPSPKQAQRLRQFEEYKASKETVILYEAPHRILATLADVIEILGRGRHLVLAREVTKLHEEFLRGTAQEIYSQLEQRPSIKGEITLLIAPATSMEAAAEPASEEDLLSEVSALIDSGVAKMDAIKQVASRHGLGKRDLYKLLVP